MMKDSLPTIVVADPDPTYQQQISALLHTSFRCITASTLREAYQTILRERPELLTLELDQPDGDGLTLIQHLQADPVLSHILVACVTKRASVSDKVHAFRAGADDYIVKPPSSTSFAGQMLLLRRAGHMARTFARR